MDIRLGIFETMALVVLVYYLGKYLNVKVSIFSKYCIPSPVVGGIIFAIVILFLKLTNTTQLTLDTTLQNLFMTAFFASIGFTASFKVLKAGGTKVFIFLGLAILLIISQDILGVALATVFRLNPLLGLCTASIPMVGGHGTAGSFGTLLEDLGVSGATTVSFASATFGLIMGSIIGGFVAKTLINREGLSTLKKSDGESIPLTDFHEDNNIHLCQSRIMNASAYIFISTGIGAVISQIIQNLGLTLPSYIGAMIVAAVIRNIVDVMDKTIEEKEIEVVGNICLEYFLTMALMGLRLWELFDLALPLFVMLVGQSLLIGLFSYFITFRVMGKNYDAVVFSSAICGFGMGSTANAVANMDALSSKYGFAATPYFVVPVVGALFIDIVNSATITMFINILK